MGRFESPGQVVALFMAASVVSVGLIFLINAEQQSRLHAQQSPPEELGQQSDLPEASERVSPKSPDSTQTPINNNHWNLLHYFQDGLRKLSQTFHFRHEKPAALSSRRRKRSPAYTQNINHQSDLHLLDGDAYAESGTSKIVPPPPPSNTEFHKIRHAMKRLGGGGLDGDAVLRMILDSKHIPPDVTHHRPAYESRGKSKSTEQSAESHLGRFERNFAVVEKLQQNHVKVQPTPIAITEYVSVTSSSTHKSLDLDSSVNVSSKGPQSPVNNSSEAIVMENLDICYKTGDVLIVILVTCCLNFAFVLLIWASVKWLSSSNKERRFQHLTCDGEDGSGASDVRATDDLFWSTNIMGECRSTKTTKKNCIASKSLYSFRPDQIPRRIFRRSRSYSMEDLRYTQT